MITFRIERAHGKTVTVDGMPFENEDVAANMCIRMAQDMGRAYRIIYPL